MSESRSTRRMPRRTQGEAAEPSTIPCPVCGGPLDRGTSGGNLSAAHCLICQVARSLAGFVYVPSYRRAVK